MKTSESTGRRAVRSCLAVLAALALLAAGGCAVCRSSPVTCGAIVVASAWVLKGSTFPQHVDGVQPPQQPPAKAPGH